MIITELPVKTYVAHYLKTRYGNPVHVPKSTSIGKLLYLLIGEESQKHDKDFRGYKDSVNVKITEDVFLRRGYLFTDTSIITFNNFMEDHIKERMFLYVDTLLMADSTIKIKAALESAIHKFDFNENVFPYETLKKAYDRYRISEKENLTIT